MTGGHMEKYNSYGEVIKSVGAMVPMGNQPICM